MVELGGGDFRQQGAGLDPIADIDIALFDVPAGARKNIGRLKGQRCRWQGDGDLTVGGADRGYPNVWNERPALLCSSGDGELCLVVAPSSYSKPTHEQQQRASAE